MGAQRSGCPSERTIRPNSVHNEQGYPPHPPSTVRAGSRVNTFLLGISRLLVIKEPLLELDLPHSDMVYQTVEEQDRGSRVGW